MSINLPRMALALALSMGCAACASPGQPQVTEKDVFGEASRLTLTAQIINPVPIYAERVARTPSDHAEQAVERYQADKVKQPVQPKTSSLAATPAPAN